MRRKLCLTRQARRLSFIPQSFIGFRLAEDNPDKHILWLTPSEYIVKTQLENLEKAGGEEFSNIKFITYSKLMRMTEEEMLELEPTFLVVDEAHRSLASCWKRGVDRLLELYPKVKLLGIFRRSGNMQGF